MAAADPATTEVVLTAGYGVDWFKELVLLDGEREVARLSTRGADRGPKTVVLAASGLATPALRLEFFKAGFLGIRTHAYTRCLDTVWCRGRSVSFLWTRDRFSSSDRP